MASSREDVRSSLEQLAEELLGEVDRIAERGTVRIRELLPSYAKLPAEELLPVTLTNTRNVLEAVLDPEAEPSRAAEHFRGSGETRVRQGITADEMLQAWRIGLEVVREEAHPVAERLGITDRVLLEFVEATLQWGDLGMRLATSAHREAEIAELERLAEAQSALRRVATLVARGSPPEEVFAQVAEEVGRLLEAESAAVLRYAHEQDAIVVGIWGEVRESARVGARFSLEGDSVSAVVYQTKRPVRFDAYRNSGGPLAAYARDAGLRCAVGTPIFVGGRVWGSLGIANSRAERLPEDAEPRMAEFTELVATAISNVQARS